MTTFASRFMFSCDIQCHAWRSMPGCPRPLIGLVFFRQNSKIGAPVGKVGLAGCSSGGATVDEAVVNAQEAVSLWVEEIINQGGDIPPPRTIESARADADIIAATAQGAVIVLVPLVRESGRAIGANISLDRGLLDAIDEAAAVGGLTRSAFLASAAREKIANESG